MIKVAKMPEKKRNKLIDNVRKRVYSCYSHEIVIKRVERIYDADSTEPKV